MTDTMPKMTLAEMGETITATRYVSDWGHGGDMRAFMGGEPKEPRSDVERAAMIAFDVAVLGESKFDTPGGVPQEDRNDLVDVIGAALRIAIVDERENGTDGRTDVDRARLVLTSMTMVKAAREHVVGLEPDPLENFELDSIRTRSGLDLSGFSEKDVHAVAVGMTDMIADPASARHVVDVVRAATKVSVDGIGEERICMADATWPAVAREPSQAPVSVAKGSFEATGPMADLQRSAGAMTDRGR